MRIQHDYIDPTLTVGTTSIEYVVGEAGVINALLNVLLIKERVIELDPEKVSRAAADFLVDEALYELGVKALQCPIYSPPENSAWVERVWERLFKDEFATIRTKRLERDKESRCRSATSRTSVT